MAGRLHIDDWRDAMIYSASTNPNMHECLAQSSFENPILSPNLAPRNWLSILRKDAHSITLSSAFWGLTPSWLEVLDQAPHCARAESLDQRAIFSKPFKNQRCIIPATGFYAWQAGLRGKQPFLITHVKRQPLMLAGIWTEYTQPNSQGRNTCALITLKAPDFLTPLTDRQPAIIDIDDLNQWLSPDTDIRDAKALLKPAPPTLLGAYPVATTINDPANQAWACGYPTGTMRTFY